MHKTHKLSVELEDTPDYELTLDDEQAEDANALADALLGTLNKKANPECAAIVVHAISTMLYTVVHVLKEKIPEVDIHKTITDTVRHWLEEDKRHER